MTAFVNVFHPAHLIDYKKKEPQASLVAETFICIIDTFW